MSLKSKSQLLIRYMATQASIPNNSTKNYKLIISDQAQLDSFNDFVSDHLNKGWELHGNHSVTHMTTFTHPCIISQALVYDSNKVKINNPDDNKLSVEC